MYLKISVDDFQRVQVRYGFQHLPHDVAGVPLRVVPLIQDPVKHLSARRPGETAHPNRGAFRLTNSNAGGEEPERNSLRQHLSQVPLTILTAPEKQSTLS